MIPGFDVDRLLENLAERFAVHLAAHMPAAQSGVAPRLLTVEQASVYLGRTKPAIQHMISDGLLPVVRSDRRVFLDVKDLDRWIEGNKESKS